jgi:hypothetical protein
MPKNNSTQITADEVKRNNVLQALVTAKDINEAAQIAEVSRKTIYTYMTSDDIFVVAYRNLKREQLRELSDKMTVGATKAADYLLSMLDDEETPPNVKLQACVKILELYAKFRELEGGINRAVFSEKQGIFDLEPTKSGL